MKAATALVALAAAGILLALGGPGVTVARADGARRVPLEIGGDGASCRAHAADDAPRVAATRTSEAMARLQEQMRRELEAGGGDVVVLNGRGYNYGRDKRPDPARELQILRREAERQRAREAE
jgi:hypothetical protein